MKWFSRSLAFSAVLLLSSGLVSAEPSQSSKPRQQTNRDLPLSDIFAPQTAKVDVVADTLEYDRPNKKVIARGNVTIHHEDMRISSDYAEVETESKKVVARGHVYVFRHDLPVAQGEVVYYDFGRDTASFPNGRALATPWFVTGTEIEQVSKGVTEIKDGHITTCDLEKPHYDIRAKRITILDGDKIIARNVRIVVLGKTIFWWPYLSIPLHETDNLPFVVNGGYHSRFGAYIETSKGFSVNKNIHGKLHLDWRSKRGVGGGVDFNYKFKRVGHGLIKTYLTKDRRAPNASNDDDPFDEKQDRLRGRVTWLHRTDFDPNTNLIMRYNRIEDEYFLQDFFYKEHRSELEPQSFVTLTKNTERFGILTHVERKMNTFESLVERQPEVRFDWKNQPFFHQGIFYENQLSFANLSKKFTRAAYDETSVRTDFFQEWSVPKNWRNIKLTPFVNFRMTDYSRTLNSDANRFRVIGGGGADLRTHFYKTYPVSFQKAGIEINQLRHVVEPSFQYTRRASTLGKERLTNFDHIDRLDDADVFTAGIENRFQTKRVVDGRVQRVDVVSLNTYLSYEIKPDAQALGTLFAPYQDNRSRSAFTIVGQEIILRPYEWLQYEGRAEFDAEKGDLRVVNQDLLLRLKKWNFIFGHRSVGKFVDIDASDQVVFQIEYILNPLWTVGGNIRYNKNNFDQWQVMARRDLHDFILDFGYNRTSSEIETNSNEIFFNFHLKAFPQLDLRAGRRSSFAPPRIGDTVAGSNQETLHSIYPEGYFSPSAVSTKGEIR